MCSLNRSKQLEPYHQERPHSRCIIPKYFHQKSSNLGNTIYVRIQIVFKRNSYSKLNLLVLISPKPSSEQKHRQQCRQSQQNSHTNNHNQSNGSHSFTAVRSSVFAHAKEVPLWTLTVSTRWVAFAVFAHA